MPGPFITDEQIAHARSIAQQITDPIFDLIQRNTTVSTERTVLRFFGISGAGAGGVPLVNLMVDKLHRAGVLNRGAAYWYGRALHLGAKSPLEAVERLTALPPEKLAPLPPDQEQSLRDEVRAEAKAAVDELKRRVDQRDALRKELGMSEAPHKYVIVATGNIYDDVDQARAAAQAGADVIAVIRSTAQSLLDYVPHGATTEGYGGTYATQENFRIMREALDDESRKLKRYVQLTNYSSGLCMAEIAFCAAAERLDMLLNDAMYGILFRDINMRRTFIDQYFSRRICALAGIIINTGEDNYITTADAFDAAHTVIASQFINECFAKRAGLADWQLGIGHSYEIDPARKDTLLLELSQAMLVRRCFPDAPLKYMPPTKHKETDIFFSHAYDVMADLVAVWTRQGIQLLGMMTEAMHTPLLADRYVALKAASYIHRAARGIDEEFVVREDGKIANRARFVFGEAMKLMQECQKEGLVAAIGKGHFGDVKRAETGGKGLEGVVEKAKDYFNPVLDVLEGQGMKALAIATALALNAGPMDPLAATTVGSLKLKAPAAWERRSQEGTTTRFAVQSGDAYFDLDVGRVQREGGMPAAECLDKILTGLGDSLFKKVTIGGQPAASRKYLDTDDKGQKFVQYSYVGCDGLTTWSLQFHLLEAKRARFGPLADKIARSIEYLK